MGTDGSVPTDSIGSFIVAQCPMASISVARVMFRCKHCALCKYSTRGSRMISQPFAAMRARFDSGPDDDVDD